jgi:DNA end-binding protein Ku
MAASVWKGHLTFGLVSFPVRLMIAARAESISFNQLHKDDNSRVKQMIYCQAEDKPIERSEIVKGYEYEKGKYVVIADEDIKKVAPKTAKTMEIHQFVKADDIDPVYFESSYYLAPDAGGEKPYALLFAALKETKFAGIAKIAMHNREHVVILRPGLRGMVMHTMYYSDEVRQEEEFRTDTVELKEKELALAKMLVESLEDKFQPEQYHDAYRDNLKKMIEAKVQGHKVVETPEPHTAPVIDIMEALKQSLAMRKPPKTATSVNEPTPISAEPKPKRAAAPRKAKTA